MPTVVTAASHGVTVRRMRPGASAHAGRKSAPLRQQTRRNSKQNSR
jgi:hypothetical protein